MKSLGMLPIESVRPNSWNVNAITGEKYAKLKEAIKASGPERTEPITVRRAEDGAWEIVNGEQRWKIAKELGWKNIPAIEVEVDRKTSKFLCLSYNALRGTVNYVRLAELVQVDPEMVEVSTAVLGKEEVEKLMKTESLTDETKKVLKESAMKGGYVSPKIIETLAEAPEDAQHKIAKATSLGTKALEDYIEATVQQAQHPEEDEEEEEEEEEATVEEAVEAGEGVEVEPKRASTVKTYQTAAYVKINGQPYLIYYDAERNKIGIMRRKMDYNSYENQMTLPSHFKFDFKCKKCGTTYIGDFELPDGKLEISEK